MVLKRDDAGDEDAYKDEVKHKKDTTSSHLFSISIFHCFFNRSEKDFVPCSKSLSKRS